jgi:hypothetical protein
VATSMGESIRERRLGSPPAQYDFGCVAHGRAVDGPAPAPLVSVSPKPGKQTCQPHATRITRSWERPRDPARTAEPVPPAGSAPTLTELIGSTGGRERGDIDATSAHYNQPVSSFDDFSGSLLCFRAADYLARFRVLECNYVPTIWLGSAHPIVPFAAYQTRDGPPSHSLTAMGLSGPAQIGDMRRWIRNRSIKCDSSSVAGNPDPRHARSSYP